MGKGTVLALHQVYRNIPVHQDDHPLLGVRWQSDTFVNTALPFGLCSAPKIFSAVADALVWILGKRGMAYQLHYLDDFLFLGRPNTQECAEALQQALVTCDQLGVPISTAQD